MCTCICKTDRELDLEDMPMPVEAKPMMCGFPLIEEAVQYAKKYGGWIAKCDDGWILWFDAAQFTQSRVIAFTRGHGTVEIGTWPMFDPDSIAAVEEAKRRILSRQ